MQNLNEKQIEAVTHFTGPLLVYAGAGSGKTSALTHRIAYLIEEKFINPWNILAVTFTNKAANEMKQRLVKLLGREEAQDSNMPTVGTFHNICVRILRKEIHLLDFENTFAIYDIVDQQILIKRIMEELFMDIKKLNPKAVLAHISNAKSQLLTHEEYANYANDFFSEKVAQIYLRYQAALRRNNALDFDDLIMKTVELFKKFPDVLDRYQEKFRFISVDEYQDTNKSQYIFIKMLAEKYQNLCVIGDSDQSIYSWRGATIQNILDFEKDYPGAKVVLLEQNYRSTQVILDAANMVIARNMQRREKKLWTEKQGGEKISQWLCDNERHEAEMILREIKSKIVGSEYPVYNDFVILYRTNAQSRVFEEAFLRHAIPYRIVGGIKFYDRKEVKDILAYLRIVQNPSDSVSLLRIINTPTRKIGDKTLLCVEDFARKHEISVFNAMLLADEIEEIPAAKKKAIEDFAKIIKELQILNAQSPASAMIKYVLDKTGYKKMVDDGSVEGEARLENISELVTVAYKYDRLENGMSLNIFLEEVSLISDLDSIEDKDNAVTLMTAHAAKGLEFQYVFVAGLEDGVFPHSRSLMDREELEEERRLMYVAMTRAKEKLYLLHSQTRMLYGEAKSNAPSQFLADINDELVERNFGQHSYRGHISIASIENRPVPIELDAGFETDLGQGDRVTHGIFGQGIVIDITGGVITVAFEDSKVGVKKLALSIAPLKRV